MKGGQVGCEVLFVMFLKIITYEGTLMYFILISFDEVINLELFDYILYLYIISQVTQTLFYFILCDRS